MMSDVVTGPGRGKGGVRAIETASRGEFRMTRLLHYSDIENVFDVPQRAAKLAGLIRHHDGGDALVVGTGDNTAPGVVSMISKGRQAVDFYTATDTALETLGNHEFDYGPGELKDLIAAAPVQWLSANVVDEDGDPFGRDVGVLPWAIRRVDATRIGFVGVTDPATDSLNPMAKTLSFTDPITAVQTAAESLRAEGIDRLVVLSHLGSGDDDLAAAVDADVILGGHLHSRRQDRVAGTLLVRPEVNGQAIHEIDLDGRPTVTRYTRDGAEPVGQVKTALTQRRAAAGLDATIDAVTKPIPRDDETVHGGECRIGNYVADAFRWEHSADVGLTNSGGLRSGDPWAGTVTLADAISLLPFQEPVVEVKLTGEELRAILREMAAPAVDFGKAGWWHGHISGARVVWNETTETLERATVAGDPVDPAATYRVGTSEYLLHSDHEFPTLTERHRAGEGDIQHEVLAAYGRVEGIDPETDGRIRIVEELSPNAAPDD